MATTPETTPHTPAQAVSIIVPVCNERDAVAETLRDLDGAMREHGARFEIIVVVNGSTDGSAEAARDSGVDARVIVHDAPLGYGGALKVGFAQARHDLVAFLDADGSYDPTELPALVDACVDADMAVGRRVGYEGHSSWARRLGKAILVPLANYLVHRKIPDLNSGMRVVRRDLVDRYWPLLPDGFSLTTTLSMALLSASRAVVWVPIRYRARKGRSKIRPLHDMRNFLILILRTVTYFRPLRVYLPLSGLLVLASAAVVVLSKVMGGQVMDVTALVLFIAGMHVMLVGVIADLVLKLLATRE